MWLPFKYTPAAWGLKGNSYNIADAEYSLTGEALEYRLLEIKHHDDTTSTEYLLSKLKLDLKHKHISEYAYRVDSTHVQYTGPEFEKKILAVEREFNRITSAEYDRAMVAMNFEGEELDLENLHLDYKEGKITENEYGKKVAGINGTAWVNGIIKMDAEGRAFMEMDWNEAFIEGLRDKGYNGLSDEEIVDMWFTNMNLHDIEAAPTFTTSTVPMADGKSEVR